MGKLDGKIALITGGNSGIGLATAKEFVNEGAYVFVTGRRKAELAAAVAAIDRNVSGVQGDMAKLADLDRLYAKIKQDKGKLDIVFENAGMAKYAALGVYSATKAALRSFARTWTTDLKSRRIRVNAISPGSTDTPGFSELVGSSETGQQRLKMLSSVVPIGRLGKPEEIAKAVVFLASTMQATSPALNCSSMADLRKSDSRS